MPVPALTPLTDSTAQGATQVMGKFAVLAQFWEFLRFNKKYWLAPIVLVLILFGLVLVLSQGSAVAPFIYTLF